MLDQAGLNRQHIFDLARLPPDLLVPLDLGEHQRQLILIGDFCKAARSAIEYGARASVALPNA